MPQHVVVDGSNIATEGRQMPSLAQLNEAVMAFMAEHPDALITVVVDATFGHRIDQKEVKEFDEAVANNELVAPPAGAVGRGDAFVLSIANKVQATILSNDSFQEFHGQYAWLFDEGRLIGGKPVPHIGWVFVPRVPVRGAVSRSATRDAKRKRNGERSGRSATVRTGSPEASLPMPVPTAPPPRARQTPTVTVTVPTSAPEAVVTAAAAAPAKGAVVNDLLPFLHFVEHHPVGSSVNAVVESYSSHGAYVRIGDVKAYVPLRLMADPAPRSAREIMKIGDAVTLVVDSFAPARRSIDLATATMATRHTPEPPPPPPARKRAAKKAAAAPEPAPAGPPAEEAPPTAARPAKRAAKKAAVAPAPADDAEVAAAQEVRADAVAPAEEPAATEQAANKAPAKKAAAKKAAAKKAPATKATAKKAPANKAAAAAEPPGATKAPAKKAPAKKAAAKKVPATKAAAPPAAEEAAAKAPVRRSRAKAAAPAS